MIMEAIDCVSYPVALALKKAGFEWKCHYGYSVKMRLEPEPSFGEPKMVHSKAPKNYNDNRKGIEKGLEFCSAVPLWQAQKWLRERKELCVTVYAQPYNGLPYYTGYILFNGDEKEVLDQDGHWFDDYEQCLSETIAAALELIEKKGE